jgi:thermitase
MRPLIAGLVIVVLFGLLVLPFPLHRGEENLATQERFSPAQEMRMKQSILQADTALTKQLCIDHCLLRINRFFQSVQINDDPQTVQQELEELKRDHPHLKWISWSSNNSANSSYEVGSSSKHAAALSKTFSNDHRLQSPYISPVYNQNGHPHVLLASTSQDGTQRIIAEVKMEVVTQVKQHQQKNLRMNVFPSKGGKTGIKTVDTDTLRSKHVDHPEDNEGTSHYREKEVVVKFDAEPSSKRLKAMEKSIDGTMVRELGPVHIFRSKSLTTKQLMNYFKQDQKIEYVEPHYIYITNEVSSVPNDLLYRDYQWNLPTIQTLQGWEFTRGNEELIIAVVDTGVDLDHPEFQGKLVKGYNFVDPNSLPYDDVGHGTHVAGVIGALTNNNEGVAGITWFNKIMPIKVLDSSGTGSTYDVAQGIIWAVDHGAKVINLSLGNYAEAAFLHDAVKYAYERDVMLIAATGNDNTSQPGYPAAYPEVLAVGATDETIALAPFSNYGDYVDVTAPGVNIASTYPQNQYAALSGTSMASPHVAALAGLIRSIRPELTSGEVSEHIKETSQDLGPVGKDPYYGVGQINVALALKKAAPQVMSTKPPLLHWPKNRWEQIRMDLLQRWGAF